VEQSKFAAHLDEMELMVKGALQCMKETHIHEEIEALDLMQILRRCGELHNHDELRMTLQGPPSLMLVGKPLAIKRCLQNIIDNGIKYGAGSSPSPASTAVTLIFTIINPMV